LSGSLRAGRPPGSFEFEEVPLCRGTVPPVGLSPKDSGVEIGVLGANLTPSAIEEANLVSAPVHPHLNALVRDVGRGFARSVERSKVR
jgi:hypothetical protein